MVDVVSVSIYSNSQRVKLTPDLQGKFLIPTYSSSRARSSRPLHKVTLVKLITHPKIKYMDPVLSLSDGSKLRVYQGGDPSGMIVMAISLCEKHDDKHQRKIPTFSKPKSRIKKVINLTAGVSSQDGSYLDDYFDYPWSDPALYDDSD